MLRPLVMTPKAGETYYIAHPRDHQQRRAGLVMVVGPAKESHSPHVWNLMAMTELIDWNRTGAGNMPYQWIPPQMTFDAPLPVLMTIVE